MRQILEHPEGIVSDDLMVVEPVADRAELGRLLDNLRNAGGVLSEEDPLIARRLLYKPAPEITAHARRLIYRAPEATVPVPRVDRLSSHQRVVLTEAWKLEQTGVAWWSMHELADHAGIDYRRVNKIKDKLFYLSMIERSVANTKTRRWKLTARGREEAARTTPDDFERARRKSENALANYERQPVKPLEIPRASGKGRKRRSPL